MLQNIASSYLNGYSLGGSNTSSGTHIATSLVIAYFIFVFIVAVFYIFCLWKIFVKAGKPGWAAIIPLYNIWILFEISGKPGWWALFIFLSFIPFVGWIPIVVLEILAAIELARRFGKSTVFGVVLLWLLTFIGYPIIAFGDAKYSAAPVTTSADDMKPQQPTLPQAPTVQ
jgi:hypothetical protein